MTSSEPRCEQKQTNSDPQVPQAPRSIHQAGLSRGIHLAFFGLLAGQFYGSLYANATFTASIPTWFGEEQIQEQLQPFTPLGEWVAKNIRDRGYVTLRAALWESIVVVALGVAGLFFVFGYFQGRYAHRWEVRLRERTVFQWLYLQGAVLFFVLDLVVEREKRMMLPFLVVGCAILFDLPVVMRWLRHFFFLGSTTEDASGITLVPSQDRSDPLPSWFQLVKPDPSLNRRRLLAILLFVILLLLAVLSFLAMFAFLLAGPRFPMGFWYRTFTFAALGLYLSSFPVAVTLVKRLYRRSASQTRRRDRRPPVILLRSFTDDHLPIVCEENQSENVLLRWLIKVFSVFGLQSKPAPRTFEEILCDIVSPCGPILAIGRPGEPVVPLGASRTWVSNERWQQVVDELLAECQFVFLILGDAKGEDGLAWEWRRVLQSQHRAKLILIVPPLPEEELRRRWDRFSEISNGEFPQFRGGEIGAFYSNDTFTVIRLSLAPKFEGERSAEIYREVLWVVEE